MRKKAWIAIGAVAVAVVVTLWFTIQPDEKSQKGATIRIGALLPLTGDAAPYGNFTKEGILVGVDKANELLKARSVRLKLSSRILVGIQKTACRLPRS